MYLGNRLLRWLVIFFYFIINYAGKQNQFVLYYIMRTCFFTHHMHLFAIVNWVACSSLMGYLVHRYIVSISVRQRKQRVKAVDKLLKDGTIAALEQRLQRLEKEVQHRGEERAIA